MPSFRFSRLLLAMRRIGFLTSLRGRHSLPQSILRRLFRFVRAEVEIGDFDSDLMMRLRLSEHMQRRIFWMGYYNRDVIAVMKRLLKPGMTVFDIGANIGEITLVAAKLVGPAGHVVAFEPIPKLVDRLEWHVARNGLGNVTVSRHALGDVVAEGVPIYASNEQEGAEENQGLGSLYRESQDQKPEQTVCVSTLDRWMESSQMDRVDLIKIDIEGAELPCLRGAEQTLRRFEPVVVIEVQAHSAERAGYRASDILDFLRALSYEFWRIDKHGALVPLHTAHLSDYQNVLCLRKEREPGPT